MNTLRIRITTRLGRLLLWVLLGLAVAAPSPVASQAPEIAAAVERAEVVERADGVERVVAVGFTVADMDRSVAFFSEVLDFEPVSDVEVSGESYERLVGVFAARLRVVRMRLGEEMIELTEYVAPRGRPFPAEAASNDLWFQHIAIVVRDMDAAYRRLREHRVTHISSGPQTLPDWNPNAGGIRAFYFRDPDGHPLELIYFPEGKGDPKWQRPTARLFLGIDHTAIGVSDTRASLAFYRDALGLRIAGSSENYGTEQEHLNSVFGAHLLITGLRGPAGPGVEFLQYLAPTGGRSMPADESANDLIHWETTLLVDDPDALAERLRQLGYRFVSGGVVEVGGELGFRRGFLVRDPDGHVMRVIADR